MKNLTAESRGGIYAENRRGLIISMLESLRFSSFSANSAVKQKMTF